jgi:hypothetical protein
VLLACRSQASWVGMANELRPFDATVQQRAMALARFHGLPALDNLYWAAVPSGQRAIKGWRDARHLLRVAA